MDCLCCVSQCQGSQTLLLSAPPAGWLFQFLPGAAWQAQQALLSACCSSAQTSSRCPCCRTLHIRGLHICKQFKRMSCPASCCSCLALDNVASHVLLCLKNLFLSGKQRSRALQCALQGAHRCLKKSLKAHYPQLKFPEALTHQPAPKARSPCVDSQHADALLLAGGRAQRDWLGAAARAPGERCQGRT